MANPYDQFDANPYDQFDAPPAAPSLGDQVKRQVGLTGRAIVEGATALPLAAADFATGAYNAVTGNRQESPSSIVSGWLDNVYGQRQGTLEKGVGLAAGALAGAALPNPTVANAAPAAFRSAKQVATDFAAQRAKDAQAAGYVIPPATSNPTALTRSLEGIAGKLSTAQLASAKNSSNTSALIANDLGLSTTTPLTRTAIQAVRKEAGDAYSVVRSAGTIQMDGQLMAALDRAQKAVSGAGKSFPALADNSAISRIEGLKQDQFDAGDAVDAIQILRDYSQQAGRQGSKYLAGVYRQVATAFENAIDRHLQAAGDPKAIAAFRAARKTIAQTYTAEKALNAATGEASALKLAQEAAKGKPLSGGMAKAAQFGTAYPKAARMMNESLPGVSPLDMYAAAGGAAASNNPSLLTLPFIRQGVRNFLFTPLGQRLAVPANRGPIDPRVVNALAVESALVGQQ